MNAPRHGRPDRENGSAQHGRCEFDVREMPFSYRGSWLNLSPVIGLQTSADEVHLVSHVNKLHPVLELKAERDGVPISTRWHAQPASFEWWNDGASVRAAFEGPQRLRMRGRGLQLRLTEPSGLLTAFTGGYLFMDPVDGAAVLTSYETGRRYRIRMIQGSMQCSGVEAVGPATRSIVLGAPGQEWDAELIEATTGAEQPRSERAFEEVVNDAHTAFAEYVTAVAPWRDSRTPAAALAAYTLWSATVARQGLMSRESVLMSKHWMGRVWSWDHCFNALALSGGLPDLALDQFLLPFDHQDGAGALPDSVGHSEVLYNYVKPPIHGWAFRRLRESLPRPLTRPELDLAFEGLSRWSAYWLTWRRVPGHRLPYYQHGNDSGWDNATTFDRDRVVEAPDLASLLILQLDVVAELGRELGRPVAVWEAARSELFTALLDELWTSDGFVAVGALSGQPSTTSSLLTVVPLVLGTELPEEARRALADRVLLHLTDHGLATELPSSRHYEDDGYWRGPIWAPSTALVEDGLRRSGFTELADVVSERFRALCEHSGFAENFDARTGQGLRDRAYTWTASVYLTLCAAYVRRTEGNEPS